MSIVEAQLGRRGWADGVIDLAEEQRFPERLTEIPVVPREINRVEGREGAGRHRWHEHGAVTVLVIPFVGRKQMHAVSNEGTAHTQRGEISRVIRLLEGRVSPLERIERDQILVLIST